MASEAQEDLSQDRLFAGMSAPADQNSGAGWNAKLTKQDWQIQQRPFANGDRIELEIANDMNCLRPATQRAQSGRVGFVLHAHAYERREDGTE